MTVWACFSPPSTLKSPKHLQEAVDIFVMVDAIGLETDFTLGPISKSILFIILLVFDTGLVFPRIWALQATFEAVLTAVDMT